MKKFMVIFLLGIFFTVVLLFMLFIPLYPMWDCLGLSYCDLNPQIACAFPGEFDYEDLESTECDYNVCISRYTVHCIDSDDNGPYTNSLVCSDYRNPFCEYGGGEPPE